MENVRLYGLDRAGPASVHAESQLLHTGDWIDSALIRGRYFGMTYRQDAMATAAQYDILLKVGDVMPLATLSVTPSSAFELQIYEGTTVSADGTPLPVGNLNRNSTRTSGVTAFVAPTVTTLGDLIFNPVAYAGGNKAPGVSTNPQRGIFKKNTNYLVRVINTDGNDSSIHSFISFIELDEADARYGD